MDLDKAIKNRTSARRFKDEKPDWRTIIECIDSARFAPVAGNIYSLKFILVDDSEKIQKLAEAAQQDFIIQAKYVVVVCSMPNMTLNSYAERGEKYLRQQAGAGIQNFLLKIEEAGLGACWVGAFVDEQVKKILDIPENVDVEAIFPIGYEVGEKIQREKIELDNILYFDTYGNRKMGSPKRVD